MFGRRDRGRWLVNAREDRGLVIPAVPARYGVDIRLCSGGAVVDPTGSVLPWEAFGAFSRDPGVEPPHTADLWKVDAWAWGRSGPIGVALAVSGRYVAETEVVRQSRRSFRNKFHRWLQDGTVVPLCAVSHISPAIDRDRELVVVLCSLLHERPQLQSRLEDAARVKQLATDIRSTSLPAVPFHAGVRRTTTEILTAMRMAGFEHHLAGRPVPGDDLPEVEVAVELILSRLRGNPYAKGMQFDRSEVEEQVRKRYLDVEPWPFAALTT